MIKKKALKIENKKYNERNNAKYVLLKYANGKI